MDVPSLIEGLLAAPAVVGLLRPGRPPSLRRLAPSGVRPRLCRGFPLRRGLRTAWRAGRALPDPALPGTADVAALAEQIGGLVRAGLPVGRAWRPVADQATGAVREAADAVLLAQHRGEQAGAALQAHLARAAAGRRPTRRRQGRTGGTGDRGALRQLVVAIRVCERTGSPLSVTLSRLAEALREQEGAAQDRESALAGPRASAAVLSLLPLAGIGLGSLLGGDPLHVLLVTAPGRVCLVVGSLLWLLGRVWTSALVRRAAAA